MTSQARAFDAGDLAHRDERMDRFAGLEARFSRRGSLVWAIHAIALVAIAITLGSALLEWLVEPQTFTSFGDACWWAITTVSSTGFGDVVPHTVAGRLVAGFTMVASLAWVPVVTAVVMTLYLRRRDEQRATEVGAALGADAVGLAEIVDRLDRLERLVLTIAPRPDLGDLADARPAADAGYQRPTYRDVRGGRRGDLSVSTRRLDLPAPLEDLGGLGAGAGGHRRRGIHDQGKDR